MKNFKTALAMENEIFKASDFNFGYNSIMENVSTAIKQILAGGDGNYVVGGAISPHPGGGLNLSIEPILAYCNATDVCVVEGKTTGPISLEEADSVNDRIDLVQIRGIEQPYDMQVRKFIDTSTGNEVIITQEVNTKKRIALDVMVKKGANGHNSAPLVDEGYIKLAEVRVEAGTNNISQDAIKNISAKKRGVDNAGWTQEKQATFNPGYLADVIHTLLVKHNEDGTLKDNSITAANIDFGTGSNQVKGSIIPVGEGLSFHDNTHIENDSVTKVIKTLARDVDSLYRYSNDLLSRYTILNSLPVAASTDNIDIAQGGEKNVDSVSCTAGQLVLLKNQTNPVENGLYTVQTGAWSRATDYDSTKPDALKHKLIFIKAGTVNKGKIFYLNGDFVRIGVDQLNFKESILTPYTRANSIMTRDENGRAKVEAPVQPDDIARLKEVNDAKTAVTNAYKAADTNILNQLNNLKTKGSAPVVGHVYIQFRGQSAPADLYPGTRWSNITSTYEGRFFRAEGWTAESFGRQQAGGLPNITGGYQRNSTQITHNGNWTGAFYPGLMQTENTSGNSAWRYSGSKYLNFDASRSNSLYGAASEVRPVNETIRIWKRTA